MAWASRSVSCSASSEVQAHRRQGLMWRRSKSVTEESTTHVLDRPPESLPVAIEPAAEPDPLAKRFLNIRTLVSFGIGLAILAFVLSRVDVNVGEIRTLLSRTHLPLFLAAMLLYYLTFPVRAL